MTDVTTSPLIFPINSYVHSTEWIGKTFLSTPSLFNTIGDVNNLSVLDVGCGFGRYCRPVLEAGASRYVGIDISHEMIDLALKNNLGIHNASFSRMDAEGMTFENQFDLTGQRAVGFVPNGISGLTSTDEDGRKFGARLLTPENVFDGQRIAIEFYDGETGAITGGTTMTWFFKEIYEKCFKTAGFEEIQWHSPTVTKEGLEKFGEEYFQTWLNPPQDIIFDVTK